MNERLNRLRTALSRSNRANWILFVVAIAIGTCFAFIVSMRSHAPNLVTIDWKQRQHCQQPLPGSDAGHPVFSAHVLADFQAHALCDEIGSRTGLGDGFSVIRSQWGLDPAALAQAIAERRFDLVLPRREDSAVSEQFLSQLYQPVAYYPSYDVFLIARDHEPQLDPSYLMERRIGLLRNTNSWSGYIVPMRQFHEAGTDPARLSIRYYPGHNALRDGLDQEDVDLIGSYWNETQQERYPDWKARRIGHVAEGVTWFLARHLHDRPEILCAVVHALRSIASRSDNPYFADIRITRAAEETCHVE